MGRRGGDRGGALLAGVRSHQGAAPSIYILLGCDPTKALHPNPDLNVGAMATFGPVFGQVVNPAPARQVDWLFDAERAEHEVTVAPFSIAKA